MLFSLTCLSLSQSSAISYSAAKRDHFAQQICIRALLNGNEFIMLSVIGGVLQVVSRYRPYRRTPMLINLQTHQMGHDLRGWPE